jgi:hypothetical protein
MDVWGTKFADCFRSRRLVSQSLSTAAAKCRRRNGRARGCVDHHSWSGTAHHWGSSEAASDQRTRIVSRVESARFSAVHACPLPHLGSEGGDEAHI